jgi:hypothetical protein
MSQSAMYSKTNDDVAFELKEERERNVSHAKKISSQEPKNMKWGKED